MRHGEYGPLQHSDSKMLKNTCILDIEHNFIGFMCYYWVRNVNDDSMRFGFDCIGYPMDVFHEFETVNDILSDLAGSCCKFIDEEIKYEYEIINFDVFVSVIAENKEDITSFKHKNYERFKMRYHKKYDTEYDKMYSCKSIKDCQ